MHRWTQLLIPTLREAPADAATISHKLLLRAGYVRQSGPGLFAWLFLGNRSMSKLAKLAGEEMSRIGQEVRLPALEPRALRKASGWWHSAGESRFAVHDHADHDFYLGTSHEEVAAQIAARELRSYKQLPQVWYHMHPAFHDEGRSKSGLLRTREFTAVSSYAFAIDAATLERTYVAHRELLSRIFERCGLRTVIAEEGIAEQEAKAFFVCTEGGEDVLVACAGCGYAATLAAAKSRLDPVVDSGPGSDDLEEVFTPQQKTIDEVAAALGVKATQVIKSYLAVALHQGADGPRQVPVLVFLRGDHQVNEGKLLAALASNGLKGAALRAMEAGEIRECFGLEPGFIGPVGLSPGNFPVNGRQRWEQPRFFVDAGLRGRRNLVAGANKPEYHLKNVTPGDAGSFKVDAGWWVDIRNVVEGDGCPACGLPLTFSPAVQIAHLRKLGTELCETMGVRVIDEHGGEVMPLMSAFGIALDRTLAACIEQSHDENGFWLPPAISPFEVVVTPTNTADAEIRAAAEEIAHSLAATGIDVLLDDRDERPGVKFKDADLVGIPYRINIGKKLAEGQVELFTRQTSSKADLPAKAVVESLRAMLAQQKLVSPTDAGQGAAALA